MVFSVQLGVFIQCTAVSLCPVLRDYSSSTCSLTSNRQGFIENLLLNTLLAQTTTLWLCVSNSLSLSLSPSFPLPLSNSLFLPLCLYTDKATTSSANRYIYAHTYSSYMSINHRQCMVPCSCVSLVSTMQLLLSGLNHKVCFHEDLGAERIIPACLGWLTTSHPLHTAGCCLEGFYVSKGELSVCKQQPPEC